MWCIPIPSRNPSFVKISVAIHWLNTLTAANRRQIHWVYRYIFNRQQIYWVYRHEKITTITDFIYFRFPEPFLGGPLPLWRRFLNLTCLLSCNSLVYSGTSEQARCIYTDRSVIRILTNIRGEQIFFVDVIIYIAISAMDYRRDGINPRIMCRQIIRQRIFAPYLPCYWLYRFHVKPCLVRPRQWRL
jgi:hypothetical protein